MTSSIFSLIWIRKIPHLGPGFCSDEMLPYLFSKTLVSMEKDQLFLEKNEPFLMLALFPEQRKLVGINYDNATIYRLNALRFHS